MELNQIERAWIGIPLEFYDPKLKTKLTKDNIKEFAYSAKVLTVRTTEDFFAEAGQAFHLLKEVKCLNACKTYTCIDLDLHDSHRDMLEHFDKLQVLALIDIQNAKNKLRLEGFLRKWFEGGKSIIILCQYDIRKLEGYSTWFLDLLKKKSEWK